MRSVTFACLSLVALLSACATPDSGYYDANGNWVPYNRYNREAHDHSPLPGGTHPPYSDDHTITTTVTTYSYDRPGYYDYQGDYMGTDSGFPVPHDMFPPRGMCRVWFPDRTPMHQPSIESCDGIRSRVPAGAYVIYGG